MSTAKITVKPLPFDTMGQCILCDHLHIGLMAIHRSNRYCGRSISICERCLNDVMEQCQKVRKHVLGASPEATSTAPETGLDGIAKTMSQICKVDTS